ncbi:hypothetical protein [Moorena producens]|uniref:hypothetical protein n=1 Tax=Moorena producens TaxID=1155739 RepID=UPI003C76F974
MVSPTRALHQDGNREQGKVRKSLDNFFQLPTLPKLPTLTTLPTPNSRLPIPDSRLPIPYSLLPTPYCQIRCSLFPIP